MGNLIVGSQSGGSVNRFAPVDLDSFHKHIEHDVIPKVYCCPRACKKYYYKKRPSDNGMNYRPPPPGMTYTLLNFGWFSDFSDLNFWRPCYYRIFLTHSLHLR